MVDEAEYVENSFEEAGKEIEIEGAPMKEEGGRSCCGAGVGVGVGVAVAGLDWSCQGAAGCCWGEGEPGTHQCGTHQPGMAWRGTSKIASKML